MRIGSVFSNLANLFSDITRASRNELADDDIFFKAAQIVGFAGN